MTSEIDTVGLTE